MESSSLEEVGEDRVSMRSELATEDQQQLMGDQRWEEEVVEYWVPTWPEMATEDQQQLYEMFGNRHWDSIKLSKASYLESKVGYALYGPPEKMPSKSDPLGYEESKLNHICKIRTKIVDLQKASPDNTDILLAVLFVSMKLTDTSAVTTPVFRIPNDCPKNITDLVNADTKFKFIDSEVRVYNSWADYLENNTLSICQYCYPRNGIYLGDEDGNVCIDFGISPAGTLKNRIVVSLDKVSTVMTLGASAIGIVALIPAIPVAAPVLITSAIGGIATGVYGMGRSISTLVDRDQHSQSIGLEDKEARNCWLATVGSAFGIASGAAIKGVSILARNGEVVGNVGRFAVTALNVGAVTVNGLGVANGLYCVIQRQNEGKLTALDVFQFSTSVFFFTNTVINFQTAESIIREIQTTVISDYSNRLRSNRHRKIFEKAVSNTKKDHDLMHGNAKVIKSINHIDNKDEFFAGLLRVNKQCNKNKARVTLTESGHVEINKNFVINPMEFSKLHKDHRQEILQATKNVAEGKWTVTQLQNKTKYIFKGNKVSSVHLTNETVTNAVSKSFGVKYINDILISGKSLLSELPHQDLCKLVTLVAEPLFQQSLKVIISWCERLGCNTAKECVEFFEFAFPYILKILHQMEDTYQNSLRKVMKTNLTFDLKNFNTENGIYGDRVQCFLDLIKESYLIVEKFMALKSDYAAFRQNEMQTENGAATVGVNDLSEYSEHNHFGTEVHTELPMAGGDNSHDGDDDVVTESSRLGDRHHFVVEEYSNRIDSQRRDEGETARRISYSSSQGYDGSSGFRGEKVSSDNQDTDCLSVAWDFTVQGDLTFDDLYKLASIVTGVPVNCNNSSILHDDPVVFLTVSDPSVHNNTIMIKSCKEELIVRVTLLGST